MNLQSVGVDDARPSKLLPIQDQQGGRDRSALEALASCPAVLMTLVGYPSSPIAKNAVTALATLVFHSETQKQNPSVQYIKAMGAIIADLLNAATYEPYWPCKRHMDSNSFTGAAVGYAPTVRVFDDLCRHGFVIRQIGQEGLGGQQGYVTRIVPTMAFVEAMHALGIEPGDRLAHFSYGKPPLPACPLRLKAGSWKKIKGKPLYVSRNAPIVQRLIAPIKQLNEYYAGHSVELDECLISCDEGEEPERLPYPSPTFFRGFNCGDVENYGWNKGGRLYADDGHYQQLRRETRQALLMDGEPTAEVDIHACYLTITYALLGKPLHATDDLYTISGVDRPAVKMFVNTTLSKGEPLKIWLPDHRQQYDKDTKLLQKQNPIKEVARRTLHALPIIKEANARGINWSTLIYHESEVMMATLQRLSFDLNLFALPMHDGLIVAKKNIAQAKATLADCFNTVLGLQPIIRVK